MNNEKSILVYLDKKEDLLTNMAKDIWDHPQIGLEETYASQVQSDFLRKKGFIITKGSGNIPTAFIAEWGCGKPKIGILGEFDALSGLSQKVSSTKEPVEPDGNGHGCGHNLLGVASLGAALAVKQEMNKEGIEGTIRYYGCPAEETLVGKIFMAKDGAFDDLDASITWHPSNINSIWAGKAVAMNSFKLNFYGRTAHSSIAPEQGRNALKGVILADIGINYLREHIIQEARIHGVITNGGVVPNTVPDFAQSWYFVRAPHREQVVEIYNKIIDIAKGAALMTGTTCKLQFITGCYETLNNQTIEDVMMEKLQKLGGPKFTEKDIEFAEELRKTMPSEQNLENSLEKMGLTEEDVGGYLSEKIILAKKGPLARGNIYYGSTDVADVSFIVPTAILLTATCPVPINVHTWQSTACMGHPIGFKAMMLASKVLALTAFDLLTKPKLLEIAQNEFKISRGNKKYVSPLLDGQDSPFQIFEQLV